MANLSYIDTAKSIEKGRLIASLNWLDNIDKITDRIVFSLLLISFVGSLSLIYFQGEIKNSNEKAIAYVVFPVVISLGLYSLFRKITESKLISIETHFGRHRNKELLLAFLEQNGYDIYRDSKEIVIVDVEESLSFNKIWKKTITFILADNKIYFNITKKYPILNPPVLFTHLFLKLDLKKYFGDKANQTASKQ
jgi:hypothetical protein